MLFNIIIYFKIKSCILERLLNWLHFHQAHIVYHFMHHSAFHCMKSTMNFLINLHRKEHAEIESDLLLIFLKMKAIQYF